MVHFLARIILANLAKLYSCKITLILHISCLSCIYLASKCKRVLPGCAYLMLEIVFNTRITEPVTVVVPINYFKVTGYHTKLKNFR